MNLNCSVYPSPAQKKQDTSSYITFEPSWLYKTWHAAFLPAGKMLPALSSHGPEDKAVPTPASPLPSIWPPSLPSASSIEGYLFFCQGPLVITAWFSKKPLNIHQETFSPNAWCSTFDEWASQIATAKR